MRVELLCELAQEAVVRAQGFSAIPLPFKQANQPSHTDLVSR